MIWQFKNADLAHLVERHLAKVEVASSSLVIRSNKTDKVACPFFIDFLSGCGAAGSVLDWGSRGRRFKSCHSDQKKASTLSMLFSMKFACASEIHFVYEILLCNMKYALRHMKKANFISHFSERKIFHNPQDYFISSKARYFIKKFQNENIFHTTINPQKSM